MIFAFSCGEWVPLLITKSHGCFGTSMISWWYAHPILQPLPAPTGPYAIGSTTECWADAHHKDPYMPTQQRELAVRWWYPTPATQDRSPAPF